MLLLFWLAGVRMISSLEELYFSLSLQTGFNGNPLRRMTGDGGSNITIGSRE